MDGKIHEERTQFMRQTERGNWKMICGREGGTSLWTTGRWNSVVHVDMLAVHKNFHISKHSV
jgi:hypothetical protein